MNLGLWLFFGLGLIIIIIGLIFLIITYIYYSVVWQTIAKKLGYNKHWIAWIPIVNIFLFPILAGKKWVQGFYIVIPTTIMLTIQILIDNGISIFEKNRLIVTLVLFILALISVIKYINWTWIIFEKRNYSGSYSLIILLSIIPILGFFAVIWYLIMLGVIAWIDK